MGDLAEGFLLLLLTASGIVVAVSLGLLVVMVAMMAGDTVALRWAAFCTPQSL
jgi:hypothetical protein